MIQPSVTFKSVKAGDPEGEVTHKPVGRGDTQEVTVRRICQEHHRRLKVALTPFQ